MGSISFRRLGKSAKFSTLNHQAFLQVFVSDKVITSKYLEQNARTERCKA